MYFVRTTTWESWFKGFKRLKWSRTYKDHIWKSDRTQWNSVPMVQCHKTRWKIDQWLVDILWRVIWGRPTLFPSFLEMNSPEHTWSWVLEPDHQSIRIQIATQTPIYMTPNIFHYLLSSAHEQLVSKAAQNIRNISIHFHKCALTWFHLHGAPGPPHWNYLLFWTIIVWPSYFSLAIEAQVLFYTGCWSH